MPAEDVSDLQDVVEAINKLCETMKTSYKEETIEEYQMEIVEETPRFVDAVPLISPEEVFINKVQVYGPELCSKSNSQISLGLVEDVETVVSDTEVTVAPVSEIYYTASSEVSLLSDLELFERATEDEGKDERKYVAGHVAAMRERFESLTRANTPCPDMMRSISPSLDVFRNVTPSPDRL